MKKNKKQRMSQTLVKFHKGALKLSISEVYTSFDGSKRVVETVGKRKNRTYITEKTNLGFRKIFWAVDSRLNYKIHNWVYSLIKNNHKIKNEYLKITKQPSIKVEV